MDKYILKINYDNAVYFLNYDNKKVIKYIPVNNYTNICLDARYLLDTLDIKIYPFEYVYKDFKEKEGSKYHHGFSNKLKSGIKYITINPTSEYPYFILLHEISHLLLEHPGSELGYDQKELEANVAAFLISSVLYDKIIISNIVKYFDLFFSQISENSICKCIEIADKIIKIIGGRND